MLTDSREVELRVQIDPGDAALEFLSQTLGPLEDYGFTDNIYQPSTQKWDLSRQYMTLREWHSGNDEGSRATLKFAMKSYRGNVKYQVFGFKLPVESLAIGQEVLSSWSFRQLFSFQRKGYAFEDPIFKVAIYLENIEYLGWSLEIESEKSNHAEWLTWFEKNSGVRCTPMPKSTLVYVAQHLGV